MDSNKRMNNILVLGTYLNFFQERLREAKEINGKWRMRVGNECQSFFQRSEKFSAEFFFRIKVFVLCPFRLFLSLPINLPTKQSFPPLKILQVSEMKKRLFRPSFETNL